MAYEKVGWKDYPDKTTPTSAANLNKMDEGIANNDKNIGDMSKISDIGDGTTAGAVEALLEEIEALKKENDELNSNLNTYLTCIYENGKLYQFDYATKSKGSEINMSPIKHIQRGTATMNNVTSVSINLSGFTNLNKMIVLLDGVGSESSNFSQNVGVKLDSLTTSKLVVGTCSYNNISTYVKFSYQVIEYV